MDVRTVEASFGEWLREQRDRVPLTQEELADKLGISVRALQTYEAGSHLPRPARRRAIVAYFTPNGEQAA